jgi:hypothetical protein
MYKYLIVAVIIFVGGGAGYYFNSSGGSKLLLQAVSQESSGVSSSEVFSGLYECTGDTGCGGITQLSLKQDGTVEVLDVLDETTSNPIGKGTWGVVHNGSIVLLLQKPVLASSSYPTSIVVKQVSIMKLSDFSSKKKLFPGMIDPVFKRIGNLDEGDTSAPTK